MGTAIKIKKISKVRSWLGKVLFLGLVVWFTIDIIRTLVYAIQSWGFLRGLSDAVFIYRLGESLIVLPLGAYLLALGRDPAFLRQARWVIWSGALLAPVSAIGLHGRVDWSILAPLTAGIGALTPWIASRNHNRIQHGLNGFALTLLLLIHLASYAAGFLFHGYALVPYPSAHPRPAPTRDERWQQDIRFLGDELVRLHMDAYHSTPEAIYWQEITRLEEAVPNQSDEQILMGMMRIVASVGDAHTRFSAWNTGLLHELPMDLRWYSDGLYVRGISKDYPQALGMRVLKIGPLEAEEVYHRMLPLISYENEPWARLNSSNLFNIYEVLQAVGAVDKNKAVTLTLEDEAGWEFNLEIPPLEPGESADFLNAEEEPAYYKSKPELPFWFEYRKASQTLYFRYSACVDPTGFRSTMQELWGLVEQQPVERLVVDLRSNGGGNSLQFERYFMPGLKKYPHLDDPQRLFVLIDRGTFSSASDNAARMKIDSKATFAGEPTGGSPNGYGEVRRFRLPNSGAQVSYSTKYFMNMNTDITSIEPDILVGIPARAVFSGRDPVLEQLIPQETW
jgi:hypothetical protein